MIRKCAGCGAIFQSEFPDKEGYVTKDLIENASICRRCFRIKNYGDYMVLEKSSNDYKAMFDFIKEKENLVLYVSDVLSLDDKINELNSFSGPVILVVTKIDLLPKSVKEEKLKNYIKQNYRLNIIDIIFVSSKKNYNIDLLLDLIEKNKKGKKVYLVGNTNAGKSSLINALIKAVKKDCLVDITTSPLFATTLGFIEVKLNDNVTLVDTPGIIDKESFLYNEKPSVVKNVSAKCEIKPRTYQMKPRQSVIIGDYARIDYLGDAKNSFTIYLSNEVKVRRINLNTNDYLKNLKQSSFDLNDRRDVVINGLCFCKITNKARVSVFTKENVRVYERGNII